jgi:branched-chain amino acid transport system substrate-binding protein
MVSSHFASISCALKNNVKHIGLSSVLAVMLTLVTSTLAMAESGVSDKRILLGQSAAFSGPAAQLGIQLHTGAKVYFDALNEAGGVHGRKIEIITADDKYEPELAAANTKKLIEQDDVFALFGYVGTPTSNAALPIFTKAKVPFFAPFTGAQSLREPFFREIFHIRSSYFDETEYLVRGMVQNGMKNIAVFYQDDAYGKAGLAGVERILSRFNLSMAVTAAVPRNSTDVKAAVNKILPYKPDAIIQVSTYTTCAAFMQAMRSASYMGLFYNLSFVGSQALAQVLGDAGAGTIISQVVPFPWSQGTPVVAEFHKAMKKFGKEKDINFSSLEGFIAAKIFTEGLRRTGKDLTRNRFIRALETIDGNDYDVGGFSINFSPTNHNGSRFVDITAISKNNKFSN